MQSDVAWSAVAELAASQHGAFSRSQAASHNIHRNKLARAVRSGLLELAAPGVLRFAGSPPTWRSRVMIATLVGSGAVASHRAAAVLHGLDGFSSSPVEITVARGNHAHVRSVIVHRWANPDFADHCVVDGIPCTNVATTIAQLGAVVHSSQVENALDDALRKGAARDWLASTVDRLHRNGPTGTGSLRKLLDDPARRGAIPDSHFERITQRILLRPDLPKPVLQHPVRVNNRTLRIDIAWPEVKYGIECHSRQHHFGPSKEHADSLRDQALAAHGWHLDYVTWRESMNPDRLVDRVSAVYRMRALQLRP